MMLSWSPTQIYQEIYVVLELYRILIQIPMELIRKVCYRLINPNAINAQGKRIKDPTYIDRSIHKLILLMRKEDRNTIEDEEEINPSSPGSVTAGIVPTEG